MELKDFKELISNVKVKRPIWFALDSDKKATENEIFEAESTLDVLLPEQYKEFVKEFGGGEFAFTNVFSLDPESAWNLVRLNEEIGLQQCGFLAISDNEVGDYYGFRVNTGQCTSQLYFFDHEDSSINVTSYPDLFSFIADIGLKGET